MEPTLRLIYFAGEMFAFALLILIVWLFKHEKLNRREFFLWICISMSLIFMSAIPSILIAIASLLGIAYTYVAVIVIGFPTFLFIFLYLFIQLSDTNRRLEKLAQRLAILEHYLHNIRDDEKAKEL